METVWATTHEELEKIYELRHTVFCEEEKYFSTTATKKEEDIFDHIANVAHFYVADNNTMVASCRIIAPSWKTAALQNSLFGLRIESEFSLAPFAQNKSRSIAELSRTCVLSQYRSSIALMQLYSGMLGFVKDQGVTDLVTGLNPLCNNPAQVRGMIDYARQNNKVFDIVQLQPLSLHPVKEDAGQLPMTLDVASRLGYRFCGEPAVCENGLSSVPMIWNVESALCHPVIKRQQRTNPLPKSYKPLSSYAA
jgi:putative hemolysin